MEDQSEETRRFRDQMWDLMISCHLSEDPFVLFSLDYVKSNATGPILKGNLFMKPVRRYLIYRLQQHTLSYIRDEETLFPATCDHQSVCFI